MIIAGLIAEYNPFHNGHLYQLEKIKQELKPDCLIVIISSYFTMRGDISVISIEEKAKIATLYGADIILELPIAFSLNNSTIFAKKAIEILNNFKITHLCFGSETCDLKLLNEILLYQSKEEYSNNLKEKLAKGCSYSFASSNYNIKIGSNDLLNIEYLKAIKIINPNILAYPIKRVIDKTYIRSAKSIRELNDIKNFVPKEIYDLYVTKKFKNNNDFFNFLKYKIKSSSSKELSNIHLVKEGLENKIKKEINNASSFDELVQKLKSKRYSITFIKRVLVSILLNILKDEVDNEELNYNRVICFSSLGQNYLNKIKKTISYSLINKKYNSKASIIQDRAKELYEFL